jgi:hypothetical protein
MANNNTKSRNVAYRKANKGNWPKPVFKAKSKPFPTPNKEVDMSLLTQRGIFYGISELT